MQFQSGHNRQVVPPSPPLFVRGFAGLVPLVRQARQALGAGFPITSPKIHGCCLFVGLGFTYTFSLFENSLSGAEALLSYWAFAFRLLSAMFCCTKLGDAACGTSRLGAVGIKKIKIKF